MTTRVLADIVGDESERHFMERVRRYARIAGWAVWHQFDSIGTRAGLPDLIMVRPPRVVFAELKSEHGRIQPEQVKVIALLDQCPGVEVYLWRPRDWVSIVEALKAV